jgi:hypothetical protein
MRILFIVLSSICVLAGVFLGGASAWSVSMGPMSKDVATLSATVAAAKEMGNATKDLKIVGGKTAADATSLLEQGLRGYRFSQIGGGLIALLNIVLLVLAIKRSSKPLLIAGGIGVAIAIAAFVITPSREIDEKLFFVNATLAVSVLGASLFAVLSDRFGARPAVAAR